MNLFDIVRYVKSLFSLAVGKAKLTPKSDTACLVVGMENSRKYGACPGSAHDAQEMGKALRKYGATTVLMDGEATRAAIKGGLQDIVKKDLAIFHYSGHGGREGDSEFLCPADGPVWDREIWQIISQAKGRVVLIFDCCHSGHMYRDAGVLGDVWRQDAGFEFRMLQTVPMAAGEHNILVWSGCPKESYSYGDSSGGVLTNGILRGLKKAVATYESVWAFASGAASAQRPVRTVMGKGFGGLVFR